MAHLMQFPAIAARMPSDYPKSMEHCVQVAIEGPDWCDGMEAWTYSQLNDSADNVKDNGCNIVFVECDDKQKRTITNDEDYGTDNIDGHEDSSMDSKDREHDSTEDADSKGSFGEEHFENHPEDASEELKEDDSKPSQEEMDEASRGAGYEGPTAETHAAGNEYDFEESKEHKDSRESEWADYIDCVQDRFGISAGQDHEDTKEHDSEDVDEHGSKDKEYGASCTR